MSNDRREGKTHINFSRPNMSGLIYGVQRPILVLPSYPNNKTHVRKWESALSPRKAVHAL